MKQVFKTYKYVLLSVSSLILFIILWEIFLNIFHVSRIVLIKPSEILATCIRDFDILSKEMLYTVSEIIPGWFIGSLMGILCAVIMYRNEKLSKGFVTTSVLINAIPLIALTAIIGGIMGTNRDQKILLVSLIVFFPVFITTLSQLTSIDQGHKDLLLSYSAKPKDILFKVLLPKSLPALTNIVKVSCITAIFTAVTSEFFGGYGGIGIFILSKKGLYNLELVWAGIFFIAVFGTIFYFTVEFLQKKLVPWQES